MLSQRFKKTLELQRDLADCGVACLLSVIKYHKGVGSIDELRAISGTTNKGCTLLGLLQAAEKKNFNAEGVRTNIEHLSNLGYPVILHTTRDKFNHYVIFYGTHKGLYVIGDPSIGIKKIKRKELEEIWVSKVALVLSPNEDFKKNKDEGKNYTWLLSLIRYDKRIITNSIILGCLISTLGLSMAIFSKKLADKILVHNDINMFYVGIYTILALMLIKTILTSLRSYTILYQARAFNIRLTTSFYRSILAHPFSFFEGRKVGDLVARLNDASRIQKVVSQFIGIFFIDVLIIVVVFPALFIFSSTAGLVVSTGFLIYATIIILHNNPIRKKQKEIMINYSTNESNYINSIKNIETIQSYNLVNDFFSKNLSIYSDFQNSIVGLGKQRVRLSFLTSSLAVLIQLGVIAVLSIQIIENEKQIGDLMAVLSLLSILSPSIGSLSLISIPLNEARVALERIDEAIIDKSEQEEENPAKVTVEFSSLSVENLFFRFPGRSPLLKGVNMTVQKGEMAVIIGESGAGKSSIVRLLQKNASPESGKIRYNQIDIEKIKMMSWHKIIGVLPQNVQLFNDTVIYNICLSRDKLVLEKAFNFCQSSGVDEYIKKLDNGYLTIVGENSENISGGQKQLIALLRLLYQSPQLLLLDEPTNGMDFNLHNLVHKILFRIKKDVGIIMITHDLKTCYHADNVYKLESGMLVKIDKERALNEFMTSTSKSPDKSINLL